MRYISTQRITRLCAMAAATVLAAGCAVNQPNVAGMAASVTPEGWSNAPLPFGAPVVFKDFWQRWNDPGLVAVVERAIAANPDVLTAAANLRAARASLLSANASLWPTASLGGNVKELVPAAVEKRLAEKYREINPAVFS